VLAVPVANVGKTEMKVVSCFRLREGALERVAGVLAAYEAAKGEKGRTAKIANVGYKTIVDAGMTWSQRDIEVFSALKPDERLRMVSKKKTTKSLLILDSGTISAYSVKPKDSISLEALEVEMDNSGKKGLSESTKYLFTLSYQQSSGLLAPAARLKLTLGTESESQRREWAFAL